MGRKRKDDSQGLPQRVYLRSGSFYYVHRSGKWENLGKDLVAAKKRAEHYNDPTGTYGTMAWFLDQFIVNCEQRLAANDIAQRTVSDYTDATVPLKAFFGAMLPTDIGPHHITEYLDIGMKTERPVRANRERACLSSCFSWMMRNNMGSMDGRANPCMRSSGVQRNPESPRERYVTHAEYREVWEMATRSERMLMGLTYRTLQRPESDIIHWTTAIVLTEGDGRVLSFRQNKTKRLHRIALNADLDALIPRLEGTVRKLHEPLVRRLDGGFYAYDGLCSMLKRSIEAANVRRKARGIGPMQSFGFRDLKGKGATDMYFIDKVPIEEIQQLCGHASKATTEKYIKARWQQTAAPNRTNFSV